MNDDDSKGFKKLVEQLAELKDTSELMIDLAYSSILLNSIELAEEVQRLEEYVDSLHTEFEYRVLTSKFSKEEAMRMLGLIRLGVSAEKIADAATQISEVILRGLKPHPILKQVISEAEETITHVHVSKNSALVNKTLKDTNIPKETGMWILAIKRGKKCIRPKPDLKIESGDILIAAGYSEGVKVLKKLASP